MLRRRSRESQEDVLWRRVQDAAAAVVPELFAAIRAEGTDRSAGAWDRYRRALTRSIVLFALYGAAAQAMKIRAKGITPAGDARFAALDLSIIEGIADIPFIEAVEAMAPHIPGIEDIVRRIAPTAENRAASILRLQRDDMLPALKRDLSRRLEQANARLRDMQAAAAANRESVIEASMESARIQAALEATGESIAESWANTHVRTAMQDAFNVGTRAQLQRNRATIPAYRLVEVQDRRTRGNPRGLYPNAAKHFQMHGFIAAADDPVWDRIWPPNGWNCRGSVEAVTVSELASMGVLRGDGTIDTSLLRRKMSRQWAILDAGQYPDRNFTKTRVAAA